MLLVKLRGQDLAVGDILRLPENYDLGPGSGPVDLLVYDPRDSDCGLGLMVVSGYKAGLALCVLPRESRGTEGGLSVDWLLAHWAEWFRFTYVDLPVPSDGATVIGWNGRRVVDDGEAGGDIALQSAVERIASAVPSEIAALLSQPAGHFIDMAELAPDLDLGEQVLVSWQPFRKDGFDLMFVYFGMQSWKSRTSMHTEHWKPGSQQKMN